MSRLLFYLYILIDFKAACNTNTTIKNILQINSLEKDAYICDVDKIEIETINEDRYIKIHSENYHML